MFIVNYVLYYNTLCLITIIKSLYFQMSRLLNFPTALVLKAAFKLFIMYLFLSLIILNTNLQLDH